MARRKPKSRRRSHATRGLNRHIPRGHVILTGAGSHDPSKREKRRKDRRDAKRHLAGHAK